MSDVSDSELLNAYLDGELTAEEQARAEKMLALSMEARQLLEELRAVSGALQSLPQQKLDEDLSARVLQIAERRMLAPDEADNSAEADKPSAGRAASDGFPRREISWRGMFSPRALIWSAIILLVAVVLHYNAPPENGNRQQARLDDKKPAATASASADEKKSKSASQPAFRAPAGQRTPASGDMPAISGQGSAGNKVAAKAEESPPMEREAERKKLGDGEILTRDRTLAHDEFAAKPAPPEKPMEESRGERTTEKRLAGEIAAKDAAGGGAPVQPVGGGGGALQREHGMYAKRAGPSAESLADTQAGQAAAKAPATTPAPSAAPAVAPPAATAAPAAAAPQIAKAGAAESNATAKGQEQATTTVRLNISAAALRNGTFNTVLLRNGLAPLAVSDDRRQAIAQFQNYGAGNGNFYGGNGQMPLVNGATAGSPPALQQIAPQSLPAANQAQGGIAQNTTPPASSQAADGQPQANSAPRGTATAAANSVNGPPAVQQNQANSIEQGPAQAITLNINGALSNGAVPLCCECVATPAQLSRVLKQLGEQRADFSRPEVVSLTPVALPESARRALGDQKSGGNQYNFEVAKGSGVPAAQAKGAEPGQTTSDADKVQALPQQRPAGKAVGGAAQWGGGRSQAKALTQAHNTAVDKTRVLFLLNVVDRVAPPPAAATPAPAKGK